MRLPMIEVAAVGVAEMDAAYAAFVLYGRGSAHPAALNFGDVFSYALAKVRGLPLLFKGDDFARTGIRPAWMAATGCRGWRACGPFDAVDPSSRSKELSLQ